MHLSDSGSTNITAAYERDSQHTWTSRPNTVHKHSHWSK